MAEIILSLIEIAFGFAGIYCLYKAVASLKMAGSPAENLSHWSRFGITAFFCMGAGVTLTGAVALGDRGLAALLLTLVLPLLFLIVGFGLAIRAGRPAKAPAEVTQQAGQVTIVRVIPGRARGFDNGLPIFLSAEDEVDLAGAEGFVRFLTADINSNLQQGALLPLLGFWNAAGTSILLYHDDEVVISARA